MNESQFLNYMICQWVLAIGTIALAIIAVWGHIIKQRWLGPKLCISLKNAKGEKSEFNDGVISKYYHLRIYNKRRAVPAHNVRVVIKDLYRPSANGEMNPISLSGPLQLAWQFQESNPQFQTIGAESTCDLGHLRQGECFRLSMLYQHISFDPTLRGNQKMIVRLVALSDECESSDLNLEISWDGNWSDDSDEMKNHLVIKPI